MAIITFFSGAYCHGDEIAEQVGRKLGYRIIDEQLMEDTTRRFDIPREKIERGLMGQESFLSKFTHEREKHLADLKIVLAELVQSDNVIIRSCAGHLIPRTIGHILRVCVIANHDYRVKQAMAAGNSEKDAEKLIHESDKRNFACTEFLLDKGAYDESLYDMTLPMHNRSIDDAVATICEYAGSEPVRTTERSRQAARDFILSARVNRTLVEEGLSADVYSENGQVIMLINKSVLRLSKYRERLVEVAEKVEGVDKASTRLGPKYKAQQVNPWSHIEGPPKFMLVDDEKEFAHTLSERLRTRDIESSIAYDGEQALDMLKDDMPDVMVLDLMMPGINGIEVLRRIKRDYPRVEVIILTGHGSERERQIAEELGAFSYLRKPVDIDKLARVMKEAYEQSGRNKSGGSETPESDEKA
jgi:two-component system response regulator CpxR